MTSYTVMCINTNSIRFDALINEILKSLTFDPYETYARFHKRLRNIIKS